MLFDEQRTFFMSFVLRGNNEESTSQESAQALSYGARERESKGAESSKYFLALLLFPYRG